MEGGNRAAGQGDQKTETEGIQRGGWTAILEFSATEWGIPWESSTLQAQSHAVNIYGAVACQRLELGVVGNVGQEVSVPCQEPVV